MKVHATIDLPNDLYQSLASFGLTKEKIASESRKLLAVKLFREKLLSFGKAAALSGLNKWEFVNLLGESGVPVIAYDKDELRREIKTAERLSKRLRIDCRK
jgi:predicted HTH domain antitoxin